MNNNILWLLKEVDRNSWDFYWSQANFSNLMQSWGYGEAKKCQGWKPFRFVLLDNFGVERGLLQILAKEVSFFGGIQLLFLGILGEYIGAVFDEVKARPLYLIDKSIKYKKKKVKITIS